MEEYEDAGRESRDAFVGKRSHACALGECGRVRSWRARAPYARSVGGKAAGTAVWRCASSPFHIPVAGLVLHSAKGSHTLDA